MFFYHIYLTIYNFILSILPSFIYIIPGTIAYKLIDNITHYGYSIIYDYFYIKKVIKSEINPRSLFSIKTEIELLNRHSLRNINDGSTTPRFSLDYGIYTIITELLGLIIVYYDAKGMVIYCRPEWMIWPWYNLINRTIRFETYLTDIYRKHCSPEEYQILYTNSTSLWSPPKIRRHTIFPNKSLNTSMNYTLTDINVFKNSSRSYEQNGELYRRGYLLYGIVGSGKTSLIEIVAKRHAMDIYSINLNTPNMNDETLVNLISDIPPNSLIAFDEIDKQIQAFTNNKYLSIGGLLTSIDGPIRLNHGCIVIMTAETNTFLPKPYMEALCRRGRLDKQIYFDKQII